MIHKVVLQIAILTPLAASPSIALSELVAFHSGMTDPTSEGWTAVPGSGGGVTVGPINDGGTDAWFLDDNSTALHSIYLYDQSIGDGDIAKGNANGWILSTTIRVSADEELAFDGSPVIGYRDGVKGWDMNFGWNASGDTFVRLYTGATSGPTHTLSGHATYNTFNLHYDPMAGNADLFLNGTEVISDYVGFLTSDTKVLWGAGRSPDRGQGNFNSVSFHTVPEPSTLLFVGFAAGAFANRSRRRLA